MTDRAETLETVMAVCEGYAAELGTETAGMLDERSQLQDVVDVPGTGWSPRDVLAVVESCEEGIGVTVTEAVRDGAKTIGQLVDAIVAAQLMPDAAPSVDTPKTTGLVLAMCWTGESAAAFGIGDTREQALGALTAAHPEAAPFSGDRIEFVDAAAAAGGGWAGVIDP